jgi:hypothetical protein
MTKNSILTGDNPFYKGSVEEVKTYDSGWQDPKPERKDQYGNTIKDKNVAKNLAKKGMAAAKKEVEEDLDEGAINGHLKAVRGWIKDGKTREQSHELAKSRGMHPKIVDDHYDNKDDVQKEETDIDAEDLLLQMEETIEYLLALEEELEENGFDIEIESDEELEENFGKMTRMQRIMAAKKAALTKRKRGSFKGGRPKSPFKLIKMRRK